jgi:hypothetical protein
LSGKNSQARTSSWTARSSVWEWTAPLFYELMRRREPFCFYVEHVESGSDPFHIICERDMEGVVAKQASARYTPDATSCVKIKNRAYSQAVGREDFFDRRRTA